MSITRRLLDDLGYAGLVEGDTDAQTGFAITGMTLFHVLKRWENHCCKSLFLNDYAEDYRRTRVDKVGDIEYLVARPSRVPTPR
jgi:hypothetical protein